MVQSIGMIEEENQRRMTRKEIQEYRVGKIAGEKVSRHQFYAWGIEFVNAAIFTPIIGICIYTRIGNSP